jgi:hypothetical protein
VPNRDVKSGCFLTPTAPERGNPGGNREATRCLMFCVSTYIRGLYIYIYIQYIYIHYVVRIYIHHYVGYIYTYIIYIHTLRGVYIYNYVLVNERMKRHGRYLG